MSSIERHMPEVEEKAEANLINCFVNMCLLPSINQ